MIDAGHEYISSARTIFLVEWRERTQQKRDAFNAAAIQGDESAMWAVNELDDLLQAIDTELAKRNEATNDQQETGA